MNRKAFGMFVLCLVSVFAIVSMAEAATLLVPDQYKTLAKAHGAAKAGDVIKVTKGGPYVGIKVTKDVTIRGTGTTKITGVAYGVVEGRKIGFYFPGALKGTGATIKGFVFDTVDFPVYSRKANNVTVLSNKMIDPIQGVTNWNGNGWKIQKNVITNVRALQNGNKVGAMAIFIGSRNNEVLSNLVSVNRIQGKLKVVSAPVGNIGGGVVLAAWSTDLLRRNIVSANEIELEPTKPNRVQSYAIILDQRVNPLTCIIKANTIKDNEMGGAQGIIAVNPEKLKDCNTFTGNVNVAGLAEGDSGVDVVAPDAVFQAY